MMYRTFIKFLLLFIVIIAAGIFYLLEVPSGLQLTVRTLKYYLPMDMQVSGNLLAPTIENLHYRNLDMDLSIKKLSFSWNPWQMVNNKIILQHLVIDGVHVKIFPQHTAKTSKKPLHHWMVFLPQALIQHVMIEENIHHFLLRQLSIDGDFGILPLDWNIKGHLVNGSISGFSEFDLPSMNADFMTSGKSTQSSLVWAVNPSQFSGTLNHQPLQIKLNAEGLNQHLQNFNLTGSLGNSQLSLQGSHMPAWDIAWNLNAPDASVFDKEAHGVINSQGYYRDLPVQQFTTQSQIKQFSYHHWSLTDLALQAHFINDQHQKSTLSLSSKNSQIPWVSLGDISLQLTGTQQQHHLQFNISNQQNTLALTLTGQLSSSGWQGMLTHVDTQVFPLQAFSLKQPVALFASHKMLQINPVCLKSKTGNLCFELNWQKGQQFDLHTTGKSISLAELNRFVAAPMTLTNLVDFAFAIHSDASPLYAGQSDIFIHPGIIHYTIPSEGYTLPFQGGKINLQFSQKIGLTSKVHLTFANNESFDGGLQVLPDGQHILNANQNISGHFVLTADHLRLLPLLIPQISNANGSLHGQLDIQGKLGNPNLSGNLAIQKASLYVPITEVLLKPIDLTLTVKSSGQWQAQGQIVSGQGHLNINGSGNIHSLKENILLHLQGNDFTVSNLSEIKIIASPNLNLKINQDSLNLTGDIFIPKAKISPSYFDNSVISTDDIEFVTPEKSKIANSNINLTSRINLTLGNDVFLSYKGIETALGGQLTIIDQPQVVTMAVGRLYSIKGKYTAFGQHLKITRGNLIFTGGPIDNPGLDIQAEKIIPMNFGTTPFNFDTIGLNVGSLFSSGQNPALKIGVNVQRTLQRPAITFYSQPSGLSQADILSYLLFGQPANNTSTNDKQTLLTAASALNFGGNAVNNITEQVKSALGLSDLSVSSDVEYGTKNSYVQNTSLILGKYLSPRLYVNYSIGLAQNINTFRVRYTLTKHWLVQADTNSLGSGLDLFYTIESH